MDWEDIANARMREINRLRGVVRDFNSFINRRNDMLFQVIEHARKETGKLFADPKDADDWLFSNFDITKEELEEIYEGKNNAPYVGEQDEGMNSQSM
ncbi:MAG: hypothetical protein FWE74_05700 [Oscillospiraceae bacterium]|nr:hypothetical protein [Oscillospiraceae bacterium]